MWPAATEFSALFLFSLNYVLRGARTRYGSTVTIRVMAGHYCRRCVSRFIPFLLLPLFLLSSPRVFYNTSLPRAFPQPYIVCESCAITHRRAIRRRGCAAVRKSGKMLVPTPFAKKKKIKNNNIYRGPTRVTYAVGVRTRSLV